MKNVSLSLLSALTATLATGALTPTTTGQAAALGAWTDKWAPVLEEQVKDFKAGQFDYGHLGALVLQADNAAMELESVFRGLDQAQVAAALVRFVAAELLPPEEAAWLAPLLSSGTLEAWVESAYRKITGKDAAVLIAVQETTATPPAAAVQAAEALPTVITPVTDDTTLPSGNPAQAVSQ